MNRVLEHKIKSLSLGTFTRRIVLAAGLFLLVFSFSVATYAEREAWDYYDSRDEQEDAWVTQMLKAFWNHLGEKLKYNPKRDNDFFDYQTGEDELSGEDFFGYEEPIWKKKLRKFLLATAGIGCIWLFITITTWFMNIKIPFFNLETIPILLGNGCISIVLVFFVFAFFVWYCLVAVK